MGEFTREYLESLSLEDLLKLYNQYDNISHNYSRYDINLCLYYSDIANNIMCEIKRREVLDNGKVRIKEEVKGIN